MGAGLRPDAKATEPPPDPTVGAPVPDSTASAATDPVVALAQLCSVEIQASNDQSRSHTRRNSVPVTTLLRRTCVSVPNDAFCPHRPTATLPVAGSTPDLGRSGLSPCFDCLGVSTMSIPLHGFKPGSSLSVPLHQPTVSKDSTKCKVGQFLPISHSPRLNHGWAIQHLPL